MKKFLQKLGYMLENQFEVLVAFPTLFGIILIDICLIVEAFAS